ncbi:hypothetical protein PVAG01_09647 [Phlyctema vagabunda]|uniref:Uncharacterized protein n=1 Tax=Phlyctema vagabunda TaxID=108571 RepID=A0ABR4P7Y0_9HELO
MKFVSVITSIKSAVSASPKLSETGSSIGYTPAAWYQYSTRTIVLVLLPVLSMAGAYGTMYLTNANGTFPYLTALISADNALLPGSRVPLLRKYTGIGVVDHQLCVLVTFFAPIVNFTYGPLTLFSIMACGQLGGAWTLLVMESMRLGNQGSFLSYIGFVGFILQNFSFASTIPLYLVLHLLRSPVAKPFPGAHANTVLLIPTLDLAILPWSITLGYIAPTVLIGLPFPTMVSYEAHQRFIALWQLFPIWTILIHWPLRKSCQYAAAHLSSRKRSPTSSGSSYIRMAGYIYVFVLFLCMSTHIPVILITLVPRSKLPETWKRLVYLARNNFFHVFVPYFPSPSYQVTKYGEGVLTFLQWDLYIGSTALLLWSVVLYRNATAERTIVDPNTSLPIYRELLTGVRGSEEEVWRKLSWKIGSWTLVSGPMGALAILLWERDAMIRQKIKQGM